MNRRLPVGELSLGLAVVALVVFVASQMMASPRLPSGRRSALRLSAEDSLSIATQYRSQIAGRGSSYGVPAWLADVHIARLQSAAERDIATHGMSPLLPADSVTAVLDDAGSGSYLTAMLEEDNNLIMRWQSTEEPIRVWVQPFSAEAGFATGLLPPVRRGFTAWNELGLGVHFAMVEDSLAADVHVTWSAVMPHSTQIGSTFRMTGGTGWISLAHVMLSTAYDVYAVQNAARHEAGHVLGLGHSPDPRDIMTAVSEGRQYQITEADRRTAELLYRLPAGAVPHATR